MRWISRIIVNVHRDTSVIVPGPALSLISRTKFLVADENAVPC